jgi:hypothetical protein
MSKLEQETDEYDKRAMQMLAYVLVPPQPPPPFQYRVLYEPLEGADICLSDSSQAWSHGEAEMFHQMYPGF